MFSTAPLVIDFEQVVSARFRVQPSESTRDWRFGLKLRSNKRFDPERYGPHHALLHLFRDNVQERLRVMYCDHQAHERLQQTGSFPGEELDGPGAYTSGEAVLEAERQSDGLHLYVAASGEPVELERIFPLPEHRYAQLWAWADSFPYNLTITYSLKEF
jgi:hypothetical protein